MHVFCCDIVLLAKSRGEINVKLKIWRNILESKDSCLSGSKIEHCNFAKRQLKVSLDK